MKLDDIINNIRSDSRELKRALVVKMVIQGVDRLLIQTTFNVSATFVSRWYVHYKNHNESASSLLLGYQGSRSYLSEREKQAIITYLKNQTSITLLELKKYLLENYQVVYKSDQSYYDLLELGKMSWKKTQKKIPKKIPMK